ncbi:NACHT, LRR and PYD domains-containing protein 1b allele 3-like isoform X2 [Pyxicephalus adspersus]|uniref:NACHT, LRR and PYD domains-containing protein 1b allele 3-like isoform X2 n=1 Tax=Pyxicephalus adspersus TaxID=30357 RepID=UPI003B5CE978
MIKKQIISTHLKNLGQKSLEKFRKNLCQMKPPRSGGPIKMADLKDKSMEEMVEFIFKCHSEKHGVSTVEKVLKAIKDNQTRVAMMRDLRKASKSTKDMKIEQNKASPSKDAADKQDSNPEFNTVPKMQYLPSRARPSFKQPAIKRSREQTCSAVPGSSKQIQVTAGRKDGQRPKHEAPKEGKQGFSTHSNFLFAPKQELLHAFSKGAVVKRKVKIKAPPLLPLVMRFEEDIKGFPPHMECRLCGKFQDSDTTLIPVLIGNVFRLELKSAGRFLCQKTGIKFQVTGPVVIDYYLESWSDFMKEIPGCKHEIIGPLFNIKTNQKPKANAVSAVYLPHYLCLGSFTEDQSCIKCAHFTEGNMTMKTPSRVEPFYIVLENPTFSWLGPLLSFMNKKIPIHGMVLIYFRVVCPGDVECQEYKIHLYLLPLLAHIEQQLDKEKMEFEFRRIAKPPQTNDTVYTKTKYLVTGHPQNYVRPKSLKFQSTDHSKPYEFTEISVKENDIDIFLDVAEESTEEKVWDTILTRGDIKDLSRSNENLNRRIIVGAEFVDKYRKDLIERMSLIDPVLDDLLAQNLLKQEQYDAIRSREHSQQKMRQLYKYTTSWGNTDKEKLYQAIQRWNRPLVRDLQGL